MAPHGVTSFPFFKSLLDWDYIIFWRLFPLQQIFPKYYCIYVIFNLEYKLIFIPELRIIHYSIKQEGSEIQSQDDMVEIEV